MCLDVDNVLQRMTIVGVILSFRQLAQSALRDVLEDRVPFLLASVQDYHQQHQLRVGGVMGNGSINGVGGVMVGGNGSVNGVGATADTMVSVLSISLILKLMALPFCYSLSVKWLRLQAWNVQ